ncbi:hypothetical protein CGGC5_v010641 [Colletotrichum fructicola Nara gc5]|uniref:Uncharacterized protein n=1 Tax=Colletotrichum fructicola (strain Nara gc5) TaxID=1213859 RepID=A0A7J6IVI0_COLFN|nr:hypothetical protein CGGC5_v010641 [Colletotrichum fructicola Nara gc5]
MTPSTGQTVAGPQIGLLMDRMSRNESVVIFAITLWHESAGTDCSYAWASRRDEMREKKSLAPPSLRRQGRAILALGLAYAGRAGSILAPASLWMGSSAEAETNFPQPDLKAATYNTVLHSSPRASINSIPLLWAGERGTWRVWNPSSCLARILPVVFFHVFDLHSRTTRPHVWEASFLRSSVRDCRGR